MLKKWFGPLWSGRTMNLRFFAEDADGGDADAGADDAGGGGSSEDPFIAGVFNEDGTFKDGWQDKFQDEIGDSPIFAKYKDLRSLVKGAAHSAKLVGRKLVPKDDASDEEWSEVFKAAGIPPKPEDYNLNLDGIEDQDFAGYLESVGFIDRVQNTLHKSGVPTKLAATIATTMMNNAQDEWSNFQKANAEARSKVEPTLGKTKWDDAVKSGREALAKLYDHSAEQPSDQMQGVIQVLENAKLMDHPYIVGMLHKLHSRMYPGKVLVAGGRPAVTRNTGPGVVEGPNYAQAMMPIGWKQVNTGNG